MPAGRPAALWGVYLLVCADDSLYCGVTTDLPARLRAHNGGKAGARYTRARRPVRLLASTGPVLSRRAALRLEIAIKRLPRGQKLPHLLRAVLP